MTNKKKRNPFWQIFILVSSLLLIAAVAAIGLFYYIFGITEPEGVSLASWPDQFTDNFSIWMGNDNGEIKIEEIGLKRLDEYGLWLQVIDETGQDLLWFLAYQTSWQDSKRYRGYFRAFLYSAD